VFSQIKKSEVGKIRTFSLKIYQNISQRKILNVKEQFFFERIVKKMTKFIFVVDLGCLEGNSSKHSISKGVYSI